MKKYILILILFCTTTFSCAQTDFDVQSLDQIFFEQDGKNVSIKNNIVNLSACPFEIIYKGNTHPNYVLRPSVIATANSKIAKQYADMKYIWTHEGTGTAWGENEIYVTNEPIELMPNNLENFRLHFSNPKHSNLWTLVNTDINHLSVIRSSGNYYNFGSGYNQNDRTFKFVIGGVNGIKELLVNTPKIFFNQTKFNKIYMIFLVGKYDPKDGSGQRHQRVIEINLN